MPEDDYVEVRCPGEFSKLFMMLNMTSLEGVYIPEKSVHEFACSDCAREKRRSGRPVKRIIHMYYLDGDFAGSKEEY